MSKCLYWLSFCVAILSPHVLGAQTATEVVLHSFRPAKGENPYSGLVRDASGSFYGTAYQGNGNAGVVYKLDPTGHYTVLHAFGDAPDGNNPTGGVVLDSQGNIYGTTYFGGSTGFAGCVYKIDAAGNESVLYSFTGGADGSHPYAGLILDSAGNLYGTTAFGGDISNIPSGYGVVFKLDPSGTETVLYEFAGGNDGATPYAGLIRDATGNFYGTTFYGGSANAGVVFKLGPRGHETVLYTFTGGADGGNPNAGVIRDSAGNLYGTTEYGGVILGYPYNVGVVYKLDTAGNQTVLHTFSGEADGGYPLAGLTRDSSGNLYGATAGAVGGAGVVYKLDTSGNFTSLYEFTGGAAGAYPYAAPIRDAAGNLYGTAEQGGKYNDGVVFKLKAQ